MKIIIKAYNASGIQIMREVVEFKDLDQEIENLNEKDRQSRISYAVTDWLRENNIEYTNFHIDL